MTPDDVPRYRGELPSLSVAQMVEVDRAMMEDFQIDLVRMMENAGRNLAALARGRFLDGDPRTRRVIVLAGSGGNGGGALVAARRLANWGAEVHVELAAPARQMKPVPAQQLQILDRLGVHPAEPGSPAPVPPPKLVIDGLIGYSLRGPPRGRARELIEWANGQPAPVLALDTPSGLNLDDGVAADPTIVAAATMTLALPKTGLRTAVARSHVGELYLADISVPPSLYAGHGLGLVVPPIFALADVVRLD